MKYLLAFIPLLFICISAHAQQTADVSACIKFDSDTFNFGSVKQDTIIVHEFIFMNASKYPIIISATWTTCSCDLANHPSEPIAPGKTGIIKYQYMTNNQLGVHDRSITIDVQSCDPNARGMSSYVLHVRGKIVAK